MALPRAPLKLDISLNGRQVSLTNIALKRAVSYRLGYITNRGGRVKILHTTSPIRTELDVNQTINNPKEVLDEIKRAHKGRTKLAVIEVTFENGIVWSIEG